MDKTTEKEPKKVRRSPEPEFFDPVGPGEGTGMKLKDLFENKSLRLGAVAVIVIFLVVVLFYPKNSRKDAKQEPVQEEKRILVTTSSMERAIDDSAKGKKQITARTEEVRERKDKRKYDTDIAVFVEKPASEGKPNRDQRAKKEDLVLGLPSGTKIPALLSDRVFSFNVEAPVIAVVAKDFLYQDKIVIPKDSEFLGEADVVKSVDRINVRFDLLILPDGREVRVRGLALSEDGSAGIKGKVDKHTDRKVLKAVGETLLAGASLFVGNRQTEPFSLEDQMRLNLTQNLTNEAARDLRASKIEKSVTVEAYTPIQVILLEAV